MKTKSAGATPKLTKSASESSCSPNLRGGAEIARQAAVDAVEDDGDDDPGDREVEAMLERHADCCQAGAEAEERDEVGKHGGGGHEATAWPAALGFRIDGGKEAAPFGRLIASRRKRRGESRRREAPQSPSRRRSPADPPRPRRRNPREDRRRAASRNGSCRCARPPRRSRLPSSSRRCASPPARRSAPRRHQSRLASLMTSAFRSFSSLALSRSALRNFPGR